jgi:undecaprenyl diphosphate synthase
MVQIDYQKLPRHIAIIMDGNGRWAQQRTMGRVLGHKRGADAVRAAVRACRELGIQYLTLYAFSVENWLRPPEEVQGLMNLLDEYLAREIDELDANGIRLLTIGAIDALPATLRGKLTAGRERTAANKDMHLTVALSYGGRDEIVQAARRLVEDGIARRITAAEVSKETFAGYLYTAGIPDPDLLIRTGGEYRISNFLLWQMAYTEFYFTDVLWPEFRRQDLLAAIATYQARERRFGLTSAQLGKASP